MEEYKQRHHAKFLERQHEREEQMRHEKETLDQLDAYIHIIEDSTNVPEVLFILKKVEDLLDTFKHDTLITKGLMLLKAINENPTISINLTNTNEVALSCKIQNFVKTILLKCGLDAEDINIVFEMDTAGDEELARKIQYEDT